MDKLQLNDLVGAGEQRRWHVEAKRLGSLEVEFVLRRLLHWKVGGLLPLEDAIDVTCRKPAPARPNWPNWTSDRRL